MDMKTICRNQVEEAKKHKWIMGEKLGYDPGDKAIEEWVNTYAKKYRDEYNKCYVDIKNKVFCKIKERIKEKNGQLTDSDIQDFVSIIIDEFTAIWTKECVSNDTNHLKEI